MEDSEIRELFEKLNIKITNIEGQTLKNCSKLDKMDLRLDKMDLRLDHMGKNTDLIPQIFEMVTANGQGIEVLSNRMDKLEK